MMDKKQLWVLAGGNGAGKTTFYQNILAPKGIKLVNADMIAKVINPQYPEIVSYESADIAEQIRRDLLKQGVSFCFETVFSHASKVDFIAKAKAMGYETILVYIHLNTSALNEARVYQRIESGGHSVPIDKIHSRIPRTMRNISSALPLTDAAYLLDNSSKDNPFQQVVIVRKGICEWMIDPRPDWAVKMISNIKA
jgi:predicted ABC-type ATPase